MQVHFYLNSLGAFCFLDKKRPKSWLTAGEIKFHHVEDKDVFKDLAFDLKGKEKIGIVGRTGAGKSSIVVALIRMTEPRRGVIYIDVVKISDIGLHDVRQNMSINMNGLIVIDWRLWSR